MKGEATKAIIKVWNTDEQAYQIDDEGNISVTRVCDGEELAISAPNITPINDTTRPGEYLVDLIAAENNYNKVSVGGTTTTENCIIISDMWNNEPTEVHLTDASIDEIIADIEPDIQFNTHYPNG